MVINFLLYNHPFDYAFVRASPTTYVLNITNSDVEKLLKFANSSSRWNPLAEMLLAIGGFRGGALSGIFSQMASQENSRATFIYSTIKIARDYNFNGIDLNWEFPTNSSDMWYLGLLFKEWRQALEFEANISLMCFGYHGSWENFTGSHSALYEPNHDLKTDYGIRSWRNVGMSAKKIVMGLPLYGATWRLQDLNVNTIGSPTIGTGPGSGILGYSQVVDFNRKNNATVVFDNTRISYYSYAGDSWISYDDVRSIESKVQYARDVSLGGYFFWALGQDLDWTLSSKASQAWLT
ncbi:acidic mammalian chitinase-like protein [Tanacetum coccineum]